MPDAGPFGETRLDARETAIAEAFFLNNPSGGCVESVFTFLTHFLLAARAILIPQSSK
jgi:hypothetical protein